METKLIPQLLIEAAKEFKLHIEAEANERILFSGKFGKGKTTFINYFFKENEEQYDTFFIDPVHYSVAANEDIFRYIKYDIILELVKKQVPVEGIYFSDKEVWSYYLAKHPMELIKRLVGYIPEVGKMIEPLIPDIEKLSEKIQKFKKEVNATSDEAKLLRFMESVDTNGFSLYENDIITELIRQMLNPAGKTKKNVLVIDNLDRIDPEHIFRILNIFSAHMDFRKDQVSVDKFYFDRVILVCDFNNIRNIFSKRYGTGVDFAGYIDKFYSTRVFYFQNYEQLRNVSRELINEIPVIESRFKTTPFVNLTGCNRYGLSALVAALVQMNLISLRQLLNFCRQPIQLNDVAIKMSSYETTMRSNSTPAFEMFMLVSIAGGYDPLVKMIEELRSCETPVEGYRTLFDQLFYYDLRSIHRLQLIDAQIIGTIGGRQYGITQKENSYDGVGLTISDLGTKSAYVPSIIDFYDVYLKILKEFFVSRVVE